MVKVGIAACMLWPVHTCFFRLAALVLAETVGVMSCSPKSQFVDQGQAKPLHPYIAQIALSNFDNHTDSRDTSRNKIQGDPVVHKGGHLRPERGELNERDLQASEFHFKHNILHLLCWCSSVCEGV